MGNTNTNQGYSLLTSPTEKNFVCEKSQELTVFIANINESDNDLEIITHKGNIILLSKSNENYDLLKSKIFVNSRYILNIILIGLVRPEFMDRIGVSNISKEYILKDIVCDNIESVDTTIISITTDISNGNTIYKTSPKINDKNELINSRNNKNYCFIYEKLSIGATMRIIYDTNFNILKVFIPEKHKCTIKIIGVIKPKDIVYLQKEIYEIIPEIYDGKRFLYINTKKIIIDDIKFTNNQNYNITYTKTQNSNLYEIIDFVLS